MMPGMSMKSDTNIKLPISFIVLGLVAFAASQIILLLNYGDMAAAQFRTPAVWSGAHFLLLGFALMVAMGAMYQLVPVAFLTPIWNQLFGVVQLIITALGFLLFSILLLVDVSHAVYGGAAAVAGILMFIFQMFKTLSRKEEKHTMFFLVTSALTALTLAIVAGFILAWNLSGASVIHHEHTLYTHITLAVAGWFTLLIFGFSYKLVPMFSLSHGYSMKWAKPALITYLAGLLVMVSSFWVTSGALQTIGWLTLLCGFVFFYLDIREILAKRLRKKLDTPFAFAVFAVKVGLSVHVLAAILSVFQISNYQIWSWMVFFM